MAFELAIISFICATAFAAFLPVGRVRMNVPNVAIVLWLGGYHLIHAINAVLWAGNVNIHIPVWCDIVTKLVLGAQIALPSAIVCISRDLELVTSYRKIATDKIVLRNRMIFDLLFCYLIPIIYMSLHIIVQDRRFDLVQDYGCVASSHPSTVGFLILWLPPLLMSGVAIVLSGITIRNISNIRGTSVNTHIESRSSVNSSVVVRQVSICMITAIASVLVKLASLFSSNSFQSWSSLQEVHRLMFKIEVVQVPEDVLNVKFFWWSFFAVSFLFLLLMFVIGEEARDIYRWVYKQVTKERHLPSFSLPLHREKMRISMTPTKPKLRPLTLDLGSVWDDEKMISTIRSSSSSVNSISPMGYSSPTQSNRAVCADKDAAFTASTLSYVGSPTAKALGITSPLDVRPQAPLPPALQPLAVPLRRSSRPSVLESQQPILRALPSAHLPADVDPDMDLTSVLDELWPLPPLSPVSSRSISQYSCPLPARSRSNSPASSPAPLESFTYPLRPTITPPHRRTRPFEGSSISSFEIDPTKPITPPRKTSMRPHHAIRTLHKAFSKERLQSQGQTFAQANEVIHMTVVRETA